MAQGTGAPPVPVAARRAALVARMPIWRPDTLDGAFARLAADFATRPLVLCDAEVATYGETLQVHTSVQEWREKVFVHKHVVMRGDTVLCEGTEVRAFCIKHPEDPDRIKAIPVPEDIKILCS